MLRPDEGGGRPSLTETREINGNHFGTITSVHDACTDFNVSVFNKFRYVVPYRCKLSYIHRVGEILSRPLSIDKALILKHVQCHFLFLSCLGMNVTVSDNKCTEMNLSNFCQYALFALLRLTCLSTIYFLV